MATREMAVINDSKTNDVYELRDKKMADAQVSTTPSDITVNSVVPVELEDGSCIKIKRDSLVQAFASVLNSNSQSTITTLFGADSNGNHANINMVNLALDLSGIYPIATKRLIIYAGTTQICTGEAAFVLFASIDTGISYSVLIPYAYGFSKTEGGCTFNRGSDGKCYVTHSYDTIMMKIIFI